MGKLWRDCKGAVTVFVTLMLIPAVLVSGTAVDLARIYTVRSVVQDANQLALNSVLTQYDAMIQDIYGLYGVMEEDEELAEMVDEYIKAAVFGEDWKETGEGTFQLIYADTDIDTEITPAPGKHLENLDVMRRQIEEYAKYRAPVVIAERIIESLNSFDKIKDDAEVIKDKMDIDDDIEDIEKTYKKIYDNLKEVHAYPAKEHALFAEINDYLGRVSREIRSLQYARDDYKSALERDEDERANELKGKYSDVMGNIRSLIRGGRVETGWMNGNYFYDEDGNRHWSSGGWTGDERVDGIEDTISQGQTYVRGIRNKINELVDLCENADRKKEDLKVKVRELEEKLDSDKCSPELKAGLTTETRDDAGNKIDDSIIDRYKALLFYDTKPMAEAMKNYDVPYLENTVLPVLEGIGFGNVFNNSLASPNLSLSDLKSLSSKAEFRIDSDSTGQLYYMAGVSSYSYTAPEAFKQFYDTSFEPTKNPEFYAQLSEMFDVDDRDSRLKGNISKSITALTGKVQSLVKGVTLAPEGAYRYKSSGSDSGTSFVDEGDWSREGEGKKQTKNALGNNIISSFGDMAGTIADKALLLVYSTEMFSCYTTEPEDKTMSGVPMSVDVNYYFQSEQEYLFNGNIESAKSNLATVNGVLFLARFVFNYIASFSITEVNQTLNALKTAVAFTGPFAIVISEAARAVFAMAESAIDIGELRMGHRVALFKTNSNWRFSLRGILEAMKEGITDIAIDFATEAESSHDHLTDDEPGLFYSDYLRLFMLMVDGETLAERTAKLIELNITNKKNDVGDKADRAARESAMSALTLVDLKKAKTDFKVDTKIELNMLFLSMGFAQKGINGIVPPKTLEVSVSDYRGY